jgi:hypothetical protein
MQVASEACGFVVIFVNIYMETSWTSNSQMNFSNKWTFVDGPSSIW